jgi:hypothetical protein
MIYISAAVQLCLLQADEDELLELLGGDAGHMRSLEGFQLHFACRDWQASAYTKVADSVCLAPGGRLLLQYDYQEPVG